MSEQLSNEEIKKRLDEQYASYPRPVCPDCNSNQNVIPCIYGMPTPELIEYAEAGHARFLGCCIIPDRPMATGFCKKCDKELHNHQNHTKILFFKSRRFLICFLCKFIVSLLRSNIVDILFQSFKLTGTNDAFYQILFIFF